MQLFLDYYNKYLKFLYELAVNILLPSVLENNEGKAPTQQTKFGFPQAEKAFAKLISLSSYLPRERTIILHLIHMDPPF